MNSRIYPRSVWNSVVNNGPSPYRIPVGARVEITCEGKTTRGFVCAYGGDWDGNRPKTIVWVSPRLTGQFPEPESRGYPEDCVRKLSLLELIAEAAA